MPTTSIKDAQDAGRLAVVHGPIDWRRYPADVEHRSFGNQISSAALDDRHDVGLLGMPSDVAIPTRPGARFGPEAIRKSLARLSADDGTRALDLDIADYGDVSPTTGNVEQTQQRCYLVAGRVVEVAALPIFIGGDHSLTYPCFRAVAEARGPLGLITFDAHHDVRTYSSASITSGTPFRRCLELGGNALRGSNLVQIGIREFCNSRAYAQYCRREGVHWFSIDAIESHGIREVAARAVELASVGTQGVYLSLDIDVVDAAFAPGASAASSGGLSAREILAGVAVVAQEAKLVAVDLMEVSPPLDEGTRTSDLAARLIARILAAR